jgi:NAD-dependent deacetylase
MNRQPSDMPGKILRDALRIFRRARHPLALTGAGISVESGIPDFRSPGGLWSIYSPEEYATFDVFLQDPEKAWTFYRELGRTLTGKKPNQAHFALARLEREGPLKGIITQNIDGLHEEAGSREVLSIHGNQHHLHCISCGHVLPLRESHLEGELPRCCCGRILKPDIVLFGEAVRDMKRIESNLERCDALLVIGTSAQVYPAASFPQEVRSRGGTIFEFNLLSCDGARGDFSAVAGGGLTRADYFFEGNATFTVPGFVDGVLSEADSL